MTLQSYMESRKRSNTRRVINVNDLMRKAKIKESREKKRTLLVVVAAASVLVISGVVISL